MSGRAPWVIDGCASDLSAPSSERQDRASTDLLDRVVDKRLDLVDSALGRELHRRRQRRREQLILVTERGEELVVDCVDDDRTLGRLSDARVRVRSDLGCGKF